MRRRADPTLADIERVYRAQFKAFMRTATAYIGDAEAAGDAVQDGVANAIRNRGLYRGEGTLEAWVWTVVLNAIRSHYRERTQTRVWAGEAGTEAAVGSLGDVTSADAIRAAVRRLPERQRLVLFLRFYADMDYASIAELLGLSEGTVGASLTAARTTLRGLLEGVRT